MLVVRCIALCTLYIHKIYDSIVAYESRILTDFYIWQTLYYIVLWRNIVPNNSSQWRHNGRDSVSNHDCLLNRLFRRRSKKTSKLRVIGLCVGNSPVTGEFPAQMASNAKNVSISWRHREHSWPNRIHHTIFISGPFLLTYFNFNPSLDE